MLAGYTVAELGSLAARDSTTLLEDMGFCLKETRTPEAARTLGSFAGAGWRELRAKLEEIVMGHAGGPIPFDRVVFEMATKGEAGCSLVSDSALHVAIRSHDRAPWGKGLGDR